MKVVFENLSNNDYDHDIIFVCFTIYSSGIEVVSVLFDDLFYKARVNIDEKGHRNFKHCGKMYGFEIVRE